MEDILENIKKHLENTPKEELEKEWDEMRSKNKCDLNVFDTFKRNGLGKKVRFNIQYGPLGKHHNKPYLGSLWSIDIYDCDCGMIS